MSAPPVLVCGLCAREFPEDRGQPACGSCPLGAGCHFIRCPFCGYENPSPPRWLGRFARWIGPMRPVDWLVKGLAPLVRRRWGADCPAGVPVPAAERCAALDCDSIRLTLLAEGERARVTCLEDPGSDRARKLAGLGILPGVDLVLLQRTPGFVFRIGHAEFALDSGLAGQIRVRKEPDGFSQPAL